MPRSIRARLIECEELLDSLRGPLGRLHSLDGARNPEASLEELVCATDKVVELRLLLYGLYAHYEKKAQVS